MHEFDFTKSFTEKVLKEYPIKKVEEKLELYAEGKQVRNPAGWLISALKNDYQDPESSLSFPRKRESIKPDEEPTEGVRQSQFPNSLSPGGTGSG